MSATTHKARKELTTVSSINPKTGRPWALTDPEMQDRVEALKARVTSSADAQQFLKDAGFLTSKGKLSKRYGG